MTIVSCNIHAPPNETYHVFGAYMLRVDVFLSFNVRLQFEEVVYYKCTLYMERNKHLLKG